MNTALVIDDLAVDRQLAARALRQRGWQVHTARNSGEAMPILRQLIDSVPIEALAILTDLDMPADPIMRTMNRPVVAGANFALSLRTSMEQGLLPRIPIIALTAISVRETHLTALAFGCDAVFQKPASTALMEEIARIVQQVRAGTTEAVGSDALLQLLRAHLMATQPVRANPGDPLTAQDITKALLAYHRQGLAGLGGSALARHLVPHATGALERGEHAYAILVHHLNAVVRLGVLDSLELLQSELIEVLSPAEQSVKLALSLSEYYRRRQEAVQVLFELLSKQNVLTS